MRCKKHITDLSSVVGVCASCLRERLFVLIAAQEQVQAALHAAAVQEDDRRKSEALPPPLLFPRSVSPYISRRKSDANPGVWADPRNRKSYRHHRSSLPGRRFYSTPQVGPNGTLVAAVSCGRKKSGAKFSFFGYFFRSKSDKLDSNRTRLDSDQVVDSTDSCSLPEPSPSWFSSIFSGRRKKHRRTFSLEEPTSGLGQRGVCRNPDRGMSPARSSDEEDEHCNNGSSGYSSESSQPWRQTPRQTPLSMPAWKKNGGGRPGHSRNVSGMTFCLSPLVRASPSRHWNKKGVPPEMVVAGDVRVVPVKPPLTNSVSFCKNRSRKLADFGRFHQNR